MTTLHLPRFVPFSILSKRFWMRANRVLAWSMIVSPAVEWAFQIPFVIGIQIFLATAVAHGVLSLVLFGVPANKAREWRVRVHVMGLRIGEFSERNSFLFSGYRIAIGLVAAALMLATGVLFETAYLALVIAVACIYPLLRQPFTVLQHIYCAVVYALRRWGMRNSAEDFAVVILVLYVVVTLINWVR